MAQKLTIGRIAKLAGVNVETIRYYQRRGLLDEPDKPFGGYRKYSEDIANRLRFIKRAQALGFTLEEVTGLLRLEEACACAETRDMATLKVAMIDQKMRGLTVMRGALNDLIHRCDAGQTTQGCPIIRALSEDDAG